MESLDDLLMQLEQTSKDLKSRTSSSSSSAPNKSTYRVKTTTTANNSTPAAARVETPVQVTSTRWSSNNNDAVRDDDGDITSRLANGGGGRLSAAASSPPSMIEEQQARRIQNRPAAKSSDNNPTANGYNNAYTRSAAQQRQDVVDEINNGRSPIMYPSNPATTGINSYKSNYNNTSNDSSGTNNMLQRQQQQRAQDQPYPKRSQSPRAAGMPLNNNSSSTTNRPFSPGSATRALDELMSSFSNSNRSTAAAAPGRHRSPSAEIEPPRPYNDLTTVSMAHAESNAELADLRGKSPTPPEPISADKSTTTTMRQQTPPQPQQRQHRQQQQRRTDDSDGRAERFSLSPVANRMQQQQAMVDYNPIEQLRTGPPVSYQEQQQVPLSYEHLAIKTVKSTTSSDDDPLRTTSPPSRPRSNTPQPTSILKVSSRSPTPPNSRAGDTRNRRIEGLNTEASTKFGEVGRPRSTTLSDNEDNGGDEEVKYEKIREYKYETTTTTKQTTTDEQLLDGGDDDALVSVSNRIRKYESNSSVNEPQPPSRRTTTSTKQSSNFQQQHANDEDSTPKFPSSSDDQQAGYASSSVVERKSRKTTTSNSAVTNSRDTDGAQRGHTTSLTRTRVRDSETPGSESFVQQPASILRNNTNNTQILATNKTCSECNLPADDASAGENPLVTALGRVFHMQCFACNKCRKILNNVPFYERQQKLWCEHDYLQNFSPKCAYCQQAIIGKCLTALQQQFHPACFKCSSCQKSLMLNNSNDTDTTTTTSSAYAEVDGGALCNECYNERYGKKCAGCSTYIRGGGTYVEALNAVWHDECFRCHVCNDVINRNTSATSNSLSQLHELDGRPICERDYYGKFGATCAACGQAINGRCITAMGKKFHPDHFTCSFCKRELNRGLFKELEGAPWCHTCWAKVFCNEEQVEIVQPATRAMPLAPLAHLNRNSPSRF